MRAIHEHVTHAREAFRFARYGGDDPPGHWHRHAVAELTWIEQGEGIRFVADNAAPFRAGDLVLLAPNVPHLWRVATSRGRTVLAASVVQFPQSLWQSPLLPELARLHKPMAQAELGLSIHGRSHAAITRALRSMATRDALGRLGALIDIFATLARGARDLKPIATCALAAAPARDASRIERVIDWIHRRLASDLPVEAAAQIAHITPAAFSRFFRRETGKTYRDYVADVRCSQACLRLRASDKAIARIAEECGFGALSNFNRQFRARWGVTPREYRRER